MTKPLWWGHVGGFWVPHKDGIREDLLNESKFLDLPPPYTPFKIHFLHCQKIPFFGLMATPFVAHLSGTRFQKVNSPHKGVLKCPVITYINDYFYIHSTLFFLKKLNKDRIMQCCLWVKTLLAKIKTLLSGLFSILTQYFSKYNNQSTGNDIWE